MKQTSDTTTADPYQHAFPAFSDDDCGRNAGKRPSKAAIFFGGREVDGLNVQAYLALMLMLFLFLMVALLRFETTPPEAVQAVFPDHPPVVKVESGTDLVDLLKENGLWEINGRIGVPPLILSSFPDNLDDLEIETKKKVFLNSLLPAALVALGEVAREKESLRKILDRFPGGYQDLDFSKDFGAWARVLNMDEIDYLLSLTRKYQTTRARQLVNRVDGVPLSLLLAQAAIESSWGSSRFAREGNNLFGIWTWGDKGMIPFDREDGMTHKVASYDTILDSIRAYLSLLNRLPYYLPFREIRRRSRNPLTLAEGLLFYSERGEGYVGELQNFIESNDLHRYDDCYLLNGPVAATGLKTVKIDRVVKDGEV